MRKRMFIVGVVMSSIMLTASGCGKQETTTVKETVEVTSEKDTTTHKEKSKKEKDKKKETETTTVPATEVTSAETKAVENETSTETVTTAKAALTATQNAGQPGTGLAESQTVAAAPAQPETYEPIETQPPTEASTQAPQPEPQPEPETTASGGGSSVLDVVDGVHLEYDMLTYVNEARRNEGLKELEWDYTAEEGCKTRAQELAVCYDHSRPDGSSETTAFPRSTGTNIGRGPFSAYEMFQAWMDSTPHRGLILSTVSEDTVVTIDTLYNPNTGGYYNVGDVIPGNTIKFCCASYDNYWVMSISTY